MCAAIEVADAEGLARLSMRKVADRLGFTTMSLYRHVPGRDQLVDLMRDAAWGELPAAEPDRDWRAALEACARQEWELYQRHPWLAEGGGARHVPGPNTVANYERMLRMVAATGLPAADVVAVVELVSRLVQAEALALVRTARIERSSGLSDEQWWRARDSLFARLDRYPTITALERAGGFVRPDPFEFGLARVLDGIELLIERCDKTCDETSSCEVCGKPLTRSSIGRPRTYCSRACQQRAYRKRGST
ncbi:TetR/AcrR family transcriptional regulator [Nocardia transvalensis]|uniref:TetR/AcrR family transcriptional regulator n=1 Tax=Nocardia transvalensis TaxID=37333 RepID=UPI002B4B1631|nr:TetR/AcrR family transcriptional regulator [Nocardia transvalensis]